jgi:hypothetical protein
MNKIFTCAFAALVCFGLASFVDMARAEASARKCLYGPNADPRRRAGSCVQVIGSGLNVASIAGGTRLTARRSIKGHSEIWTVNAGAAGFHYNTSEQVFWNTSWVNFNNFYTSDIVVNRNLPNNSLVCSRFWSFYEGRWRGQGDVCVKVHR